MTIKLTYFGIRGRAETARLILAYAGVQYEDERVAVEPEEIAKLKASWRYGQLPMLTVDGETIYQSMAIARYLAKLYGLGGANAMENAQIDEVVDALSDLLQALGPLTGLPGEEIQGEERERKVKDVLAKAIPEGLLRLEKHLSNRGSQFFVGNSFSWAELHFLSVMDFIKAFTLNEEFLEPTPKLKNSLARVRALPNIYAWLETRPNTTF